ncbi:hypothetical protein PLESTB_000853400 [Pleodorina starrii]|uniref:Uncharacterized protein n=1 Tax=Pleodorina starrii TaxID=330485 RepID=A0A9W6F2M4_9CHLO|nr:hypothetical protein PLESTB_000853400 [Pleodorina starrii]
MDFRFTLRGEPAPRGSPKFTLYIEPSEIHELFQFNAAFGAWPTPGQYMPQSFCISYKSAAARDKFRAECIRAFIDVAPAFAAVVRTDVLQITERTGAKKERTATFSAQELHQITESGDVDVGSIGRNVHKSALDIMWTCPLLPEYGCPTMASTFVYWTDLVRSVLVRGQARLIKQGAEDALYVRDSDPVVGVRISEEEQKQHAVERYGAAAAGFGCIRHFDWEADSDGAAASTHTFSLHLMEYASSVAITGMAEACAIGVHFDTTSAVVRPLYPGDKKPLVQIACVPVWPEPRREPPGACSRPCGDPMAYLEDEVEVLVKPPTDTGPAHTMWSATPAIAVIGVAEAATQEHTLKFVKRTMEGFGAVDGAPGRQSLRCSWTTSDHGSEVVAPIIRANNGVTPAVYLTDVSGCLLEGRRWPQTQNGEPYIPHLIDSSHHAKAAANTIRGTPFRPKLDPQHQAGPGKWLAFRGLQQIRQIANLAAAELYGLALVSFLSATKEFRIGNEDYQVPLITSSSRLANQKTALRGSEDGGGGTGGTDDGDELMEPPPELPPAPDGVADAVVQPGCEDEAAEAV